MKTVPAVAAVLLATALIVPTVSHAEPITSVRVSYADLNLTSAQDQQQLGRRIAFAAKTVCDLGETTKELQLRSATKLCRDDAIARVQPAYLAAIDAARHGTVRVLDAGALIITAQ